MSDSYTHQMEANLDAGRQIYLEDLVDSIPCVSLEFFKKSVLPPLSTTTLSNILKKLKPSIVDGRWRDFPTNPSSCGEKENEVFAKFPALCDAIMTAAEGEFPGKAALLKVQACPDQNLKSEITVHNTFRVDASAMLLVGKGKHSLVARRTAENAPPPARSTRSATKQAKAQEAALPPSQDTSDCGWLVELKKREGSAFRNDNVLKVVGAATHMLFNDPCRRFIFAVTIEDTSARFWFFSRFLVMVSRPFNFITEHLHLVHYVVCLGYATEAEIGYDPNMERVLDDTGEVQYDIRVNGVCYRTIKVLDNHRAARAISRATRVWEVRRRDNPSSPSCVLKDVWLSEDADSEQDIQRAIFANMNKVHPIPDFDPDYQRKYFMTILADECVDIHGQKDRSSSLIMRNEKLPDSVASFPLVVQTASRGADSVKRTSGAVGSKTSLIPRGRNNQSWFCDPMYEPKQHRRIVFKELGKTLSTEDDHKTIFMALGSTVTALKHLYSAGYVHRDISTGNLLLCDSFCKVSDLEYAKAYDKGTTSNVEAVPRPAHPVQHASKSGTPAFMPHEIQQGRHCFLPEIKLKPPVLHRHEGGMGYNSGDEDEADSEDDTDLVVQSNHCMLDYNWPSFQLPDEPALDVAEYALDLIGRKLGTSSTAVRHNYLHDLESVWWIAEWTMFVTSPAPTDPKAAQISVTDEVFPHSIHGSSTRDAFFIDLDYHAEVVALLPKKFHRSIAYLMSCRTSLIGAYKAFESHDSANGGPFDFEPWYRIFLRHIQLAWQEAHNGTCVFLPKPEPPDYSEANAPPSAEPQSGNKEPSVGDARLESTASKRSAGDALESTRSKRQRNDTKKDKKPAPSQASGNSRKSKRTQSKSTLKRTRTKSR